MVTASQTHIFSAAYNHSTVIIIDSVSTSYSESDTIQINENTHYQQLTVYYDVTLCQNCVSVYFLTYWFHTSRVFI